MSDEIRYVRDYLYSFVKKPQRASSYAFIRPYVEGKLGLELGGLSGVFTRIGVLPVYAVAGRVDNCNINSRLVRPRSLYMVRGHDYRLDATRLPFLSYSYDFVLSSHTLEHIANPLKAVAEWARVLKVGGLLLLVVPHKEMTFDKGRPTTEMKHLIEDYTSDTGEMDKYHFEECLRYDGENKRLFEELRKEWRRGEIHQHTFVPELVKEVVEWTGLNILCLEVVEPHHIVVGGVKQ